MDTHTPASPLPNHDIQISAYDDFSLGIECYPCRWEEDLGVEVTPERIASRAQAHRNGLEKEIVVPFKYTEKERRDAAGYRS